MRRQLPVIPALLLSPAVLLTAPSASGALLWWDETRDEPPGPPGQLLSDNEGYWGERVLTGVQYRYEAEPDNPADVWKDRAEVFGRRLLDGKPAGNWWVPVGVNGRPLVVVFDFRRPCAFREVDVSTRSQQVALRVEVGEGEQGPWRLATERSREDCPAQPFHRLRLPEDATGRYLRLSVEAEGITWVEEVLVWGEGEVSAAFPEAIDPIVAPPQTTGVAFQSLPGADKTAFSDAQFWEWQRALGDAARVAAVCSSVPTWDTISDRPLLPTPSAIIREASVTLARNESECLALALTNTSCEEARHLELSLSPVTRPGGRAAGRITGELRVAGLIGSRWYGVNVGPLLAADNLPDDGLLARYLTNGAGLAALPRVTLPPAGSAVLWVSLTTTDCPPGRYEATLSTGDGPAVRLSVQVLDVTLPAPEVWLNTWSGVTNMFPFEYDDRLAREVAYKQSLGVTVWHGFPKPGTEAAFARERGRAIHQVLGLPADYVNRGYNNQLKPEELTAEDRAKIADHVRALVREAEGLGLTYADWYAELWDEPGEANAALYRALCRIIRETDPRVRVYCNPCFWVDNGVLDDVRVFAALGPWYREGVDVSVPLFLLLEDRPQCFELFDAPRAIRAFYAVATQSAKGEASAQVEGYRRQAWDAFRRGWNGWGFYSYYAPRESPWTDFDQSWTEDLPDYQMVYPGPRGPIPTRQSEAVREGWEDYRLLTLLRTQGRAAKVRALLEGYAAGRPLTELRGEALEAAAE